MALAKHKSQFFSSTKKFLFLLVFIFHVSESQVSNDLKSCGTIFSEANSVHITFPLDDGDKFSDMGRDFRVSKTGWNEPRSVAVEEGCKIKTCNDTKQDRTCDTLNSGFHSVTENPFIKDITSLKCTCPKNCNCSDIHIKKSSCGRAYLEGGCSTYGALYSDLSQNSIQGDVFPEDFNSKVEAIRLRKGCTVSIYSEEYFEGEMTFIDQEIVENFNGIIGSYECQCNDSLYEPKSRPPRPETYPQLIDIPTSMNDVIQMLGTDDFSTHPGLRAARQSYINGRSSKNAYILLLGSTDSGKHSAINLLFGNINATNDEDDSSSKIREFRIPVPIDELGIANSELRVIDIPDLGDRRGSIQDAKTLATLENYLSMHEELKDRIPNAVLIFYPFNDKKFESMGTDFVKMIRRFDTFTDRITGITDENFSNIIFVFTHLCSEDKMTRRRPQGRINKFEKIIQDYTLFPRPTHIVVAENKAEELGLPMVNGYFKLPNNEYYPRNLFEKLDLVTEKGGDPIGQGVFRAAFRDSEDFNVTLSSHYSADSDQVKKYLSIFTGTYCTFPGLVNKTEIFQVLEETWENKVDPQLRQMRPHSLENLQRALSDRNISRLEDVPRTDTDILKLLMSIKNDDATRALLWEGLGLKSPKFPVNTVAGYSYDVFNDMSLPISPFKLDDLQHSDTGFMIPKSLTCRLDQDTKDHYELFNEKREYLQHRFHSLGIDGFVIPIDKFTDMLKPGLNMKSVSMKNDSCIVTAAKDFRMFKFLLNDRFNLADEFIASVEELTPFNDTDPGNVEIWKKFLNTYGTHVVKSVYGGGSIVIKLESGGTCDTEFFETVDHILFNLENNLLLELNERNDSNKTIHDVNSFIMQSMTFIGGTPDNDFVDISEMPATELRTTFKNWKKSLRFNPTILSTEMRLEPISLVVRKMGHNYTEEIERATMLLFNSSFVYVATPPKNKNGPGPDRDNTPLMPVSLSTNSKAEFDWEEVVKKVIVPVVTTVIKDKGSAFLNRPVSEKFVSILDHAGVKVEAKDNATIKVSDIARTFFSFFNDSDED